MTGFGGAPGSRGHSGSGGVGAKLARVEAERGWKESERRRQAKSYCSRWAETSESSVRSARSVVQTVLHPHKLRQSRLPQTCHSYGVALLRRYSTGISEESFLPSKSGHLRRNPTHI